MHFGDAAVVAIKKREKVAREIILIERSQPPHNAEVVKNKAPLRVDMDIARMHIGVKKSIAENLREKNLDAVAGEAAQIDSGGGEGFGLRDGNAAQKLHHHRLARAKIPMDFRHARARVGGEIAAQLGAVGGFEQKVGFDFKMAVELVDDGAGAQALAVGQAAIRQRGRRGAARRYRGRRRGGHWGAKP